MPENSYNSYVRIHRVGTITTGLCFVGFGILFILHTAFNLFTYEWILTMWPLILIALGIEILLSNKYYQNFVYDKAGAFMIIIMGLFSMMMAFADMCMKAGWGHIYVE
ncbi:LiaF transmembrane domain-containing protein [Butyrivibrio sp. MB2005]|jgi:hypothetical protein|uniref:LiaF transmembrane domain-containing protein n=1 Tax=Butyrivibrio sp. MB2005 TaxID=1280678 RepID=UPI0004250D1E|nr:DUF5668 domain-containing protein [Butyrivibrio sp. MB2005]